MNILQLFKKKETKVADIDVTNAENLLSKVESFTIPDIDKIDTYIKAFDIILKKSSIDDVFKVVKYIEQRSSNGLIYIIQLKKSKSKYSKLLIKIQRSERSDPASYEYYIGMALNKLRGMNVPNFGLVYGRFYCGFNPSKKILCDKRAEGKTYVLYEYITSLSDKTITLEDYINSKNESIEKKNINMVNILVMLLISLQKAQDEMKLTHYDLHLGNVLLVKLNATYNFICEYDGKKYNIILDYFPFIIDYGRSHVSPKFIDKIEKEIYDSDNKKYYKNFETYQNEMWKNTKFKVYDKTTYKSVIKHITELLNNSRFVSRLKTVMEREFNIKDQKITVEMILDKFYNDEDGNISYGITPWKFNESFDHCKLLNHVCDGMIERYGDKASLWNILSKELLLNFPFIIPGYYGITKYYKFTKYDFKKPIDAVEFLYIDLEFLEIDGLDMNSKVYNKLYFNQIGGDQSEKLYKKLYKKMKRKFR